MCAKGPACTSKESIAGVLWVYISLCLGLRLLKVEESGFPKTRLFFLYDKSIFLGYYRILSHCIFQTSLCSIPLESKSSYGFTSSPGSFCPRAVCPPHLVPFVFPLYYWYFHIRAASQEMFKDLFMKLLLEVFPEVFSHHTIPPPTPWNQVSNWLGWLRLLAFQSRAAADVCRLLSSV